MAVIAVANWERGRDTNWGLRDVTRPGNEVLISAGPVKVRGIVSAVTDSGLHVSVAGQVMVPFSAIDSAAVTLRGGEPK